MSFSDPLGDMLTRIRNSQMRSRSVCLTPASNLRGRVLDVLADEGFIKGYNETEVDGFRAFEIQLKYFEGQGVIRNIKRVSKPGRRVYSDHAAREANVGGEILCHVS